MRGGRGAPAWNRRDVAAPPGGRKAHLSRDHLTPAWVREQRDREGGSCLGGDLSEGQAQVRASPGPANSPSGKTRRRPSHSPPTGPLGHGWHLRAQRVLAGRATADPAGRLHGTQRRTAAPRPSACRGIWGWPFEKPAFSHSQDDTEGPQPWTPRLTTGPHLCPGCGEP